MARYGKFSDFIYTIAIFVLGILFSIYMGTMRGDYSKDLLELVNKIQG